MLNQFINLKLKERNTPIYRVFSMQRLLESCSAKKNTLVKPSLWDDPFENFILTAALEALNNPNPFMTVKDQFYGQCWSTLEESDAMWRIYSPDKNGVKVRTTIGKLLDALNNAPEKNGECFIGKVSYLKDRILRKKLQDASWLSQEVVNSTTQANSLLFKRLEFEHEAEVRLLYLSNSPATNNLFNYFLEPRAVFDEIQFDPRISDEIFQAYKYYLEEKIGFRNPITKSQLYKLPDLSKK